MKRNSKLNMRTSNENCYKNVEELKVPTGGAVPVYQTLNRQNVQSNVYDVIKPEKCSNVRKTIKQRIFSKTFLFSLIAANVALLILGIVAIVLFILSSQTVLHQVDKIMDTTQSTVTTCCQSHETVAFTATGCKGNNSIIFPNIIHNIGGAYDSYSGEFTCQVPGVYYFASVLIKVKGKGISDCFLYVNSYRTVGAGQTGSSLTLSGIFYLHASDTVYVACDNGASDIKANGSFTGILVTAKEYFL